MSGSGFGFDVMSLNPHFLGILSLIVGVVCIFLQIMGFICLREGVAAKTIISVAVALALMPLVVLFLPSSNGV